MPDFAVTSSQSAEQDDDNKHAKDAEGMNIVLKVRRTSQLCPTKKERSPSRLHGGTLHVGSHAKRIQRAAYNMCMSVACYSRRVQLNPDNLAKATVTIIRSYFSL